MKKIILFISLITIASVEAQDNYWRKVALEKMERENGERRIKEIQNKTYQSTRSNSPSASMAKSQSTKTPAYYYDDYDDYDEKPQTTTKNRFDVGNYTPDNAKYEKRNINFDDGSNYQGNTRNGKFHGAGKLTFKDGGYFEGEFLYGKMRSGKRVYKDGSIFLQKEVNDDLIIGTLQQTNGTQFEGKFFRDPTTEKFVLKGVAKMTTKSGTIQHGYYNGYNVERFAKVYYNEDGDTFKKGDRYEGQVKNGMRHGRGIYYHADGRIEDGYFAERKFIGVNPPPGTPDMLLADEITDGPLPDGVYLAKRNLEKGTYIGLMKEEKPQGKGTLTMPSGEYFEGDWANGEFVKGYWRYADKKPKYYGEFKNLLPHGWGENYNKSSSSPNKRGFWVEGKYIGDDEDKFLKKVKGN